MKTVIFLLAATALTLNACSTGETTPPQVEQNISQPSIPEVKNPEPPPLVVEPQFDNSMSSEPRVELKTRLGDNSVPQVKSSQPSAPEAQNFQNPLTPQTQAPLPQSNPSNNSDSQFGTGNSQSPFQNPVPEANNFQSPILTQPQVPIKQTQPTEPPKSQF